MQAQNGSGKKLISVLKLSPSIGIGLDLDNLLEVSIGGDGRNTKGPRFDFPKLEWTEPRGNKYTVNNSCNKITTTPPAFFFAAMVKNETNCGVRSKASEHRDESGNERGRITHSFRSKIHSIDINGFVARIFDPGGIIISGLITSTTLALSLYAFSDSSLKFKKVMNLMCVHNKQGALHSDGHRAGRKLGGSIENGGLVEYFFGTDGKGRLHHDKFVQFLRNLHEEMVKLESAHYDYKLGGTISAKDIALSMVASADIKNMSKLLDRVDEFDNDPHLGNISITPEEFKNFSELLRKLQPSSRALGHNSGGRSIFQEHETFESREVFRSLFPCLLDVMEDWNIVIKQFPKVEAWGQAYDEEGGNVNNMKGMEKKVVWMYNSSEDSGGKMVYMRKKRLLTVFWHIAVRF